MTKSKISDFLKSKGEFSHTRLISIIGSLVVFGTFVYEPTNTGLQNLMAIVISGSLINATASKFSKQEYGNESASNKEVWDAESEQSEYGSVGCTCGARDRGNSQTHIL
jgi:hypothetical protein